MKAIFLIIIYGYFIAPIIMAVGGYLVYTNWVWAGSIIISAGVAILISRIVFSGVTFQ